MTAASIRLRDGLTLIELLVSTALTLVIVAIATAAFTQMLTTTRRLQTKQTMDASAKTVYEKLYREATAIHPCAAMWLISNASEKSVEWVFMRGKENPTDFTTNTSLFNNNAKFELFDYTDLQWSRWKWYFNTRTLEVSESRSARWFQIDETQARDYWKITGGSKVIHKDGDPVHLGWSPFIAIPQPRRETGNAAYPSSPIGILNENAWQSGESTDIGDYEDLVRTARPLLSDCFALVIEVEDVNGSKHTADGLSNLTWSMSGHFVDGRDHADLQAQPRLVRMRFVLRTQDEEVSNTYSISCPTPILQSGGATP